MDQKGIKVKVTSFSLLFHSLASSQMDFAQHGFLLTYNEYITEMKNVHYIN